MTPGPFKTPALVDEAIYVPTPDAPPEAARLVERARNEIVAAMRTIEAHALDAVIIIANDGARVDVRLVLRKTLLATPGGPARAHELLAERAPPRRYHCVVIPVEGQEHGMFAMLFGEPVQGARGGEA